MVFQHEDTKNRSGPLHTEAGVFCFFAAVQADGEEGHGFEGSAVLERTRVDPAHTRDLFEDLRDLMGGCGRVGANKIVTVQIFFEVREKLGW